MMGLLKYFLPDQASTFARDVDSLIVFISVVSIFFFVLITALGVYFVLKFKRKPTDQFTSPIDQNHKLEVAWTVIPSLILLVMFLWGFKLYMNMVVVPANAIQINVTGQKWFWTFGYDNGYTSTGEMVVPLNKPVKVLITSKDVIHSFFVPAFRVKKDAVPNRYSIAWFQPSKAGTYPLYCAEYCGTSHSAMVAKVKVVPQEEYDDWLNKAMNESDSSVPLVDIGKRVYEKNACNTCHTLDGTKLVGPTWKNLYGSDRKISGGTLVKGDENYIRESIVNPMAKIVEGYAPAMPTYQGLLTEREIEGVIAYMKELK